MILKIEDIEKVRGINLFYKNTLPLNNVLDLNQSISKCKKEILDNFLLEKVTFHTLTFNIEKLLKNNVRDLTNLVEKYLKILKNKTKVNLKYFYSYEIGDDKQHIHLHSIFNIELDCKEEESLIKKWNEVNDWPFYNRKGLVIEYLNTEIDKINVINYILKGFNDIDKLLSIYYFMYPQNIFHFSKLNNNININELVFDNLALHYKIIKPNKITLKVKDIYKKWTIVHESANTDLKILVNIIKNENLDINFKQKEIDLYESQRIYGLNIEALYNKSNILKLYLQKYLKEIQESNFLLNIKEFNNFFFSTFFNLEQIYYYFVDTLITGFRICVKENKELNDLYRKQKNEVSELSWNVNVEDHLLKSIFKNNIKYYVFCIKIKEIKKSITYREGVKFSIEKLNLTNKAELKFLIDLKNYMDKDDKDEDLKSLYIDYKVTLETNWIYFWNYLIEVFTKIGMIEFNKKQYNNKQIKVISINKDLLYNLIFILNNNHYSLPRLVLAAKEELKNKVNINFFKYNRSNLYYENKYIKYNLLENNKKLLENIEKQEFKLNINFFNYILSLDIEMLSVFMNWNFSETKKFVNLIENYSVFQKEKNKNFIIGELYNINEFFEQIYIAEAFLSFKKLYFNIKIDERGRQYKAEYPLNFMHNKLIRNLFNFSYYKELIIERKIENIKIYKDLLNNLLKTNKDENKYLIFNILKNPLSCMLGMDATTQIYQLQGSQIIDLKLLEITKLIDMKRFADYDLYKWLQEKLINELMTNNKDKLLNLLELRKNAFKKYIEKLKITQNNNIFLVNLEYLKILNNIEVLNNLLSQLNRSLIKSIIMTYGYNKSIIQLIKDTTIIIFQSFYKTKLSNDILILDKKIITLVITSLLDIFNREFKGLKDLRLLFSAIACLSNFLNEPIYINISENNEFDSFYQYYYIENYIKIQKWFTYPKNHQQIVLKKGINIQVNFLDEVIKNKSNLRKNINALLPNYHHYLDGILCINIWNTAFKKKINVITVHDCFYVNLDDIENIKDIYREQFENIIIKDILKILLNNYINKLKLNASFNKFIQLANLDNDFLDKKSKIKKFNDKDLDKIRLYILKIHKLYNKLKIQREVDYGTLKKYILEDYKSSNILKMG